MYPFDYIDPLYFLIAFAIGLLYAYITQPKPEIITKYPTPFNIDTVYKDSNDVCYKYQMIKSSCPADLSKIKRYEII